MSDHLTSARADTRADVRLRLPAMYTLIRVRPAGAQRYRWTGHIYDISLSGMRFELDSALEPGTAVEVRAMLPGAQHTTIEAAGRIIRLHDDADEPGPVRMGMVIESFATAMDRGKLERYLEAAQPRLAA